MASDPVWGLVRHVVAALGYRAARVCEGAPEGFAAFRASGATRAAGAVLAHMGDLLEWAAGLVAGKSAWRPAAARAWGEEVGRFFAALARLDAALAGEAAPRCPAERLLQGPLADALTHVGQLAMLRRAAGSPMVGENYYKADITAGRLTKDLAAPAAPF